MTIKRIAVPIILSSMFTFFSGQPGFGTDLMTYDDALCLCGLHTHDVCNFCHEFAGRERMAAERVLATFFSQARGIKFTASPPALSV